jgi:hypothetical protein
MIIERRFEPDPEALERLVEILYGVLIGPPKADAESTESSPAEPQDPTCVTPEHEG